MSKYNIFVKIEKITVNVKCNDFNSLKSGIENKLRISLSDYHFEYHNKERKEWIGIFDDDDLENVTEQTQVRLIKEYIGENI